ncbi:phage major capsid protein [Staphylococcus kloosii]|uniref:phage major capsid protein n=1 Tax=Staphylococcus kloosii TaxID=29384 RepID=UPI002B4BBBD9|nr:phage major capsid protein [Staphylococcus kloosii]
MIAENNAKQELNTTNKAIAEVLKSFEAREVADTDGIKKVLNVDLDPSYNVSFVVTQSFYNILDTLKDKNGQYILKQDITAESGTSLFGRPVYIIKDELLGAKGNASAFVGDVKLAVLFANRVNGTGVKWIDNSIYGQLLAIYSRFSTVMADDKAGYFMTYKPAESTDNAGA